MIFIVICIAIRNAGSIFADVMLAASLVWRTQMVIRAHENSYRIEMRTNTFTNLHVLLRRFEFFT